MTTATQPRDRLTEIRAILAEAAVREARMQMIGALAQCDCPELRDVHQFLNGAMLCIDDAIERLES